MNIVIYIDQNYAAPATVMVRSLIESTKSPSIQLFVLGVNLPARIKQEMACGWPQDRIRIHWRDVDKEVETYAFTRINYLSSAAYIRLLIDRLLPPDVNRVITLDCDGVILCDLAELWRTDFRGHAVMAVRDPCIPTLRDDHSAFISELDVDESVPYFNSGLMGIDLKKWRELDISGRSVELVRRFPGQALYADQSYLNAVLQGEWKCLPVRWNCNRRHLNLHCYPSIRGQVYPAKEVDEARANPAFVHFLSRSKPWHPVPFHPHRGLYEHYRERTGVRVDRRHFSKGRTLFYQLRLALRAYRQAFGMTRKLRVRARWFGDLTFLLKELFHSFGEVFES